MQISELKLNWLLSRFLRSVASHGHSRHQEPRDRLPALQQLSGEQPGALLLPPEREEEQGREEEEADQGRHWHAQQLPVSHRGPRLRVHVLFSVNSSPI